MSWSANASQGQLTRRQTHITATRPVGFASCKNSKIQKISKIQKASKIQRTSKTKKVKSRKPIKSRKPSIQINQYPAAGSLRFYHLVPLITGKESKHFHMPNILCNIHFHMPNILCSMCRRVLLSIGGYFWERKAYRLFSVLQEDHLTNMRH